MGGRDKVMAVAKQAFDDGDGQFAAELTQLLVRIDKDDWDARHLKAASLRQRGYQEINTIARAWYLNGANELDGKINPAVLMKLGMATVQGNLTGAELLQSWRYQVDAEKAGDKGIVLGLEFTDSGDSYTVELRNSILEISPGPVATEIPTVSLSAAQLRDILAGKPAPDGTGDTATLTSLLSYLDRENKGFYMHLR
jgi:alkyl sulfatase BDS1-like metallo-beta-lactamase superfamily hydrolase